MKVYKTNLFNKWAKKEKLNDVVLIKMIEEMKEGLIDAQLGAGLVKKRIPKSGHGKRGSYRSLLAFKVDRRAILLIGYSKSETDNITHDEKEVFKELCKIYLSMNHRQIERMCKTKKLIEVKYEKA